MPAARTGVIAGAWARALIAVAVWGASFVAVQVALEAFTPLGLVAARLLLGGALLLLLQRLTAGPLLPEREDRSATLWLGVILAVHMLLQTTGLLTTSAVNTGWIIAAIPAAIALGARVFLALRLSPAGWSGVALASAGVLVVVGASPAELAGARFGDGLAAGSCFTWAAYTLIAGKPVARSGALRITAATMVVAAALVLPAVPLQGWFVATPGARQWLAFGFLALACSAMAYLFWYQALAALGPVRTGATLYAEPFFTLAASALVLGETGGGGTLAGGLLVLAGVFLVQRAARRPGRPEHEPA